MLFNLLEEICSILLLGIMFFAFLKQHVTNLSIYQASRFRANAGVYSNVICHRYQLFSLWKNYSKHTKSFC